jgi:hypothetical protein
VVASCGHGKEAYNADTAQRQADDLESKWSAVQQKYRRRRRPREDFSQSAARIVIEATLRTCARSPAASWILTTSMTPENGSMDGWQWSTAGRAQDLEEKSQIINYGKGGSNCDSEGTSRNVNFGLATVAERTAWQPAYPQDPNILPVFITK